MTTPTTPEGRRELKALAERVQIGMACYVQPEDLFKERAKLLGDGAATVLSLLAALEEAEERIESERSVLEAWFDTSKRVEADAGPLLRGAFAGYLRTCRSGGLAAKQSDSALRLFDDFADKYLGPALAPIFMAERARAEASEQREAGLREILQEFAAVYALHEDGDGNPCSIVARARAALTTKSGEA